MNPERAAAASSDVIDNGDGSYTAKSRALWEGRVNIQAAIISPAEVIAAALRRR